MYVRMVNRGSFVVFIIVSKNARDFVAYVELITVSKIANAI